MISESKFLYQIPVKHKVNIRVKIYFTLKFRYKYSTVFIYISNI